MPTQNSIILEEDIRENLNEQLRIEESLWHQKSRNTFNNHIPQHQIFSHLHFHKARKNNIDNLKIEVMQCTSDLSVIKTKFQEHFQRIYNTFTPEIADEIESLFPNKISESENDFLCKIPSDEEILSTIKQIPSSKIAGLDRFTSLFYKHY